MVGWGGGRGEGGGEGRGEGGGERRGKWRQLRIFAIIKIDDLNIMKSRHQFKG